jgi:hypothetical protein
MESNMKSKLKTPTIRITTLIQAAAFMVLGGYIGAEYQTMKLAAAQSEVQTLEQIGFTNKPALPVFIEAPIEREQEVNQQRGF